MDTKITTLGGVNFITSVNFKFPFDAIKDCPPCCGAGIGFGEMIVPETLWGLKISPCCWVHDECWKIAKPTWADFHQTNAMFMTNILAMILKGSSLLGPLRTYRAATYYNFVTFAGAPLFWACKEKQKLEGKIWIE